MMNNEIKPTDIVYFIARTIPNTSNMLVKEEYLQHSDKSGAKFEAMLFLVCIARSQAIGDFILFLPKDFREAMMDGINKYILDYATNEGITERLPKDTFDRDIFLLKRADLYIDDYLEFKDDPNWLMKQTFHAIYHSPLQAKITMENCSSNSSFGYLFPSLVKLSVPAFITGLRHITEIAAFQQFKK